MLICRDGLVLGEVLLAQAGVETVSSGGLLKMGIAEVSCSLEFGDPADQGERTFLLRSSTSDVSFTEFFALHKLCT